jgi:hypothetical protein
LSEGRAVLIQAPMSMNLQVLVLFRKSLSPTTSFAPTGEPALAAQGDADLQAQSHAGFVTPVVWRIWQ